MEYRTAICRLCLVTDDRMYAVGGTPLQIVYEKLTNIQFLDPTKPVVACHICLAYLKKSWKLMVTSLKADNVFIDFLKNNSPIDLKSMGLIDRRAYGLANGLVTTLVELTDRPPEEVKVEEDLEVKKESEPPFFPGLVEEPIVTIPLGPTPVTIPPPNFEMELLKEETDEWLHDTAADTTRVSSDSDDDLPIKRPAKRQAAKRAPAKRAAAKRSPRTPAKRAPAKRAPAKRANSKRAPKAVVPFVEPPKEEELKEDGKIELDSKDDKPEDNSRVKDDTRLEDDTRVEDDDDDSDYEPPAEKEEPLEDIEPGAKRKRKQKKQIVAATATDLKRLLSLRRVRISNRRQYVCQFCKLVTATSPEMRAHLKLHRPFECEVCQKGFKTAWHKTVHTKIHTGEKPHMCSMCGARFRENFQLNKHVRIMHTGEKPYTCSVCSKSFKQKSHMKRHEIIHSGDLPFECHVCQRKFNQRTNLKTHLKKHGKVKAEDVNET